MTSMIEIKEQDRRSSETTRQILSVLESLSSHTDIQLTSSLIKQLLVQHDLQAELQQKQFASILNSIADFCLLDGQPHKSLQTRFTLLKSLAQQPLSEKTIATLFQVDAKQESAPDLPAVKVPSQETVKEKIRKKIENNAVSDAKNKRTFDNIQRIQTSSLSDGILSGMGCELSELRSSLLKKMDGTSNHYHEFSELLGSLSNQLSDARDSKELDSVKSLLRNKVRRMIEDHHVLSEHISATGNEIVRFESYCKELNRELDEAKQMSLTDELTGLPNRRAFLSRLDNETGRVQRYGYPLAVALLDLDYFKEVNDTLGHEAGDDVLRCYAKRVLSTFRDYDLVCRYGGEEFAVILPHTDSKGAMRAVNKVRRLATETLFDVTNSRKQKNVPTFSAGITLYKSGENSTDLLERADKAMYQAKRLGRNRVEFAVE